MEKKIEALVLAGNVLDEHGFWVPIQEQVKREKAFLAHLAHGEVLQNGKWIEMALLQRSVSGVPHGAVEADDETEHQFHHHDADPTRMLATPEETIGMSLETVAAMAQHPLHAPEPHEGEGDFPPETAELKVETIHELKNETPPPKSQFQLDGQTQVDIPIHQLVDDEKKSILPELDATEFQETVMFNIKAIQTEIDEKKKRKKR